MNQKGKSIAGADKPPQETNHALTYLEHRIPEYPFDPKIDRDFVEELIEDFGPVHVLEEIKSFRWYNDSKGVSNLRSVRLALRRWIAKPNRRKTN